MHSLPAFISFLVILNMLLCEVRNKKRIVARTTSGSELYSYTSFVYLQNRWSPTYDVAAILTSIQSLLDEPNPNSPANSLAAQLYQENRREYEKRVQQIVEQAFFITNFWHFLGNNVSALMSSIEIHEFFRFTNHSVNSSLCLVLRYVFLKICPLRHYCRILNAANNFGNFDVTYCSHG